MSNDVTTHRSTAVPAQYALARMSVDQLREQIGRAISMTADSIAYLAAVWVELEVAINASPRHGGHSGVSGKIAVIGVVAGEVDGDAILHLCLRFGNGFAEGRTRARWSSACLIVTGVPKVVGLMRVVAISITPPLRLRACAAAR